MMSSPSLTIRLMVAFAIAACEVKGFTILRTYQNTAMARDTSALSMVTPPSLDLSRPRKPVALKHLFRHYDDISMDCFLRCADPEDFLLSCGYTSNDIKAMAQEYPALLEKDVHDHLAPHVRFLVRALEGGSGDLMWIPEEPYAADEEEECNVAPADNESETHRLRVSDLAKQVLPVKTFFNLRLEKALAPWHAYMAWQEGLPSGKTLLEQEDGAKFQEFLDICQSGKLDRFVEWCNEQDVKGKQHTAEAISDFTFAFHEGLVPAVRSHLHVDSKKVDCKPGRMVELLLSHGANHLEDDHHGASLMHWAAGTGNMEAVRALLQAGKEDGVPLPDVIAMDQVAKDGASVLHWAASGVTPLGVFGCGGHVEICRLLLDLAGRDLADKTTYSQNSVLDWAAWSGSLDVVKLLIEDYGANPHFCSDSGNVAHWACAGGSLSVCQYLADSCGVDFCTPNKAKGLTPLDLASSEYHPDVAEWLTQRFYKTTGEDRGYQVREELQSEVVRSLKMESQQKNDIKPAN